MTYLLSNLVGVKNNFPKKTESNRLNTRKDVKEKALKSITRLWTKNILIKAININLNESTNGLQEKFRKLNKMKPKIKIENENNDFYYELI